MPDQELDRDATKGQGTDAIILGRRTYQVLEAFWPHALENPNLPPEMQAMATTLNETTKLVFSKTLDNLGWKNSQLIRNFDPQEIQAMKEQPGKDMIIIGSGSIVSQFTQHHLIDEYQFVVTPLLLGNGMPLMSGVSATTALELKDVKGYPSGNVLLRYSRRDEAFPAESHFQR